MRKLWVVLLLAGFLAGCGAIKQLKEDAYSCKNDPVCYEAAKELAESWENKSEAVGAGVAVAYPPAAVAVRPASKAVGALALILALLVGGKALRTKKEEE